MKTSMVISFIIIIAISVIFFGIAIKSKVKKPSLREPTWSLAEEISKLEKKQQDIIQQISK